MVEDRASSINDERSSSSTLLPGHNATSLHHRIGAGEDDDDDMDVDVGGVNDLWTRGIDTIPTQSTTNLSNSSTNVTNTISRNVPLETG